MFKDIWLDYGFRGIDDAIKFFGCYQQVRFAPDIADAIKQLKKLKKNLTKCKA